MHSFLLLPALAMLADSEPGQFLPKDFLVEVQVVESRIEKDLSEVKLKILHVYAGPPKLKGITFSLNKDAIAPGPARYAPFPIYDAPIEKLEKSIILVQYEKDHDIDIAPWRSAEPRFVSLPVRDIKTNTRYKQAVEWAKAVEAVAQKRVEDRPALLREFALHKTTEIAAWSINALGADSSDATSQFLDGLVFRESVNAHARMTLDTVLLKRLGKEWKDSKRRLDMIRRMAQSTTDESELLSVVHFLKTGSTKNESGFSPDVAISLTASLMKNSELPGSVRIEAFQATKMIAHREGLIEAGFDAFVDRVKNDKNVGLRRLAAVQIGELIDPSTEFHRRPSNLSFDQRDQVKQILKGEKDEIVTWRLEEVLEKAKKNDKPLKDKELDR